MAIGQRVFVSSAMAGMEGPRLDAAAAIERVGAEPVLFERFGGEDADPQGAYLSEVRSSGIYVGLLGARYGRPLDTRYSATHTEYLEAEDAGLRISMWVDRTANMEGPQQSFLEEVRQFHTTGSYSSPEELGNSLNARLARIAAEDLSPWVKMGHVIFRAKEITYTGQRVGVRAVVRDRQVMGALERMRPQDFRVFEGPLTWRHTSTRARVVSVDTITTAAAAATVTLVAEVIGQHPQPGWPRDVTYRSSGRTLTSTDIAEANLRAGLCGDPLPESDFGFGGLEAINPLLPLGDARIADEAVRPIAELLLTEHLIGGKLAEDIVHFRLGPQVRGRRRLQLSWRPEINYVGLPQNLRTVEGFTTLS